MALETKYVAPDIELAKSKVNNILSIIKMDAKFMKTQGVNPKEFNVSRQKQFGILPLVYQ
jgi:hypothetical protein